MSIISRRAPTVDKSEIGLVNSMDKAEKYQWLLDSYPTVVTKEQLYKVCHVSKKTALYYIESGLIPCKCSGKQTRKYTIMTTDLVDFLEKRDESPDDFHAPNGWYKGAPSSCPCHLSPQQRQRLQEALEYITESYPDVLTVDEVMEITGYVNTSIHKWCQAKKVVAFRISGKYMIPKVSLLEYLVSDAYLSIHAKSRKHYLLLAKTLKESEND